MASSLEIRSEPGREDERHFMEGGQHAPSQDSLGRTPWSWMLTAYRKEMRLGTFAGTDRKGS